jgi:thiamine-phosphate pyrophosphorylase
MLIYVTNRQLCHDNFFNRIDRLAKGKPWAIMLREKDLDLAEYESLAHKVKAICEANHVPLIVNQNTSVALKLNIPNIHLSMPNLRDHRKGLWSFHRIGASVHSIQEAVEAQALGASYVIAGHIFSTESKAGIPPRGLSFLKELSASVTIPVFAIGGITTDKVRAIAKTEADGICLMSEAMTCSNPTELAKLYNI